MEASALKPAGASNYVTQNIFIILVKNVWQYGSVTKKDTYE
jgi:hypothetical protein